ncbi:MAG: DoxX family protein [Rhizobiaceae bacterium]
MTAILLLAARAMLAAMFLHSGTVALSDVDGAAAYFAGLGLPLPNLVTIATGIFEIVAGVLLVIGFQTRLVAAALALFSIVATWLGHAGQGADAGAAFMHTQMLLKDIAVAGGLVAFAIYGAGGLSVDARR